MNSIHRQSQSIGGDYQDACPSSGAKILRPQLEINRPIRLYGEIAIAVVTAPAPGMEGQPDAPRDISGPILRARMPLLFPVHQIRVQSRLAATVTRAYADGRAPATSTSASRSSIMRTALPSAVFDICAVKIPQRSGENLLPNPPPTWSWSTRMLLAGICSGSA